MSFGNASGGDPPVGPPPSAGDQPGRAPAGPDAVPSGSRDLLPPRAPAEHPSTGDPFGGETNCHSTGYERFTLPDGARLVATAAGPDGRSVLAVDGVEATVDALTTQAGDSPDLSLDAAEATQPDGQEAARRVILITAGGGACELLASADEEHLLMTGHSD